MYVALMFRFYHTTDTSASCGDKFAVQSSGGISIIRNFDDSPIVYSGEATEAGVVEFAKKGAMPQLINFSDDYIEAIFAE